MSTPGYEIVVGVCGGVAAYKVCQVVSRLAQDGVGVQVVMTAAAQRFVGAATFQALSGRAVFDSLWPTPGYAGQQHIQLTEQADLCVVAPATANMLAKAAWGLADDLLSTVLLSTDCPVLYAPAMNTRMWEHAAVQHNMATLRDRGSHFIEPAAGWLACRTVGAGRMAEPEQICDAVHAMLRSAPPRRAE